MDRNGPTPSQPGYSGAVTPSEHKDYSATPLARKLGIREGSRVSVVAPPDGFSLGPLPRGTETVTAARGRPDVTLLFVRTLAELRRRFPTLVRTLQPGGRLWVAWPKKTSGLRTDLSFDLVQGLGLEAGLVDNKSSSIDEAYQGLQFVYRLKDRPAARH
jgi:hypothetical protein